MGTTNDSRALPPSDIDLVHVVTVDELLAMHQLQHVDLLKVGAEMSAIGGAVASIAAGRVGVLTFLYDGHNEWQHGKLRDVIARMDELGYACYLAGKQTAEGSLLRLTGCWRPSYETRTPSTIVCVPRSHALYPHVERMSMRYSLYREEYFKEDAVQPEAAQPEQQSGMLE
ncbi:expressed protein [Chlorella variabilis]|uniref:Expressed protein n=1 Tax=Chlorella variabilis TaxID=554065 RepID=E1ZC96_CHLVA|nr:expressed protein [Chlorella variabilis]EFN56572.1 expressed protein [Chlorella variabilis]|eukprot:XP_005848674.1 expressed protein [Chlorella variabilis]